MSDWFCAIAGSKWFPVLYILALVVGGSLCLMIRNRILLRPSRRPPYELFPVPSACYFRLRRCPNMQVEDIFTDRLEDSRFWKKVAEVAMILRREREEPMQTVGESPSQRLMGILLDAGFYSIVPCWFPTVVGYAALSGPDSKEVVLGLDPWLVSIPCLARSAADHELVHCVQHVRHNIFTLEWRGRIPGRFLYELQANWVGGRLILLSFIAALIWPLLLYVAVALRLGG